MYDPKNTPDEAKIEPVAAPAPSPERELAPGVFIADPPWHLIEMIDGDGEEVNEALFESPPSDGSKKTPPA